MRCVGVLTVDEQTRVSGIVGAREGDAGGGGGARALDAELVARHVVLSTVGGTSGVESDGLGTEKVVAGGDVTRNGEALQTAALVDEIVGPGLVGLEVASLVNLEELAGAVGGGGVIDGAKVDHDGAVVGAADGLLGAVAVVVLVHLDGDGVASLDAAGGGGGARVGVATHVVGRGVLDGRVGRGHADAGAGLVHAVHPQLLEDGVTGNHVSHGGGESEGGDGLHRE